MINKELLLQHALIIMLLLGLNIYLDHAYAISVITVLLVNFSGLERI